MRTLLPVSRPRAHQHRPGRSAYRLSLAVAALAGLASLAGLLLRDVYTGPPSVAAMLRGYDVVTLAGAVPVLVASVVRSDRGSDRAVLVWVGMLAYLAYIYAFYMFGVGFNDLFLLHIAVFGGAVLALVVTVSGLDAAGIADRFDPRTPTQVVAVVLALLAAGLGGLWVSAAVLNAVTGEVPVGSALVESDSVVHLAIALDLALLVPAYALAAGLLWRTRPAGYVLAAMLLVSGTLHQASYMVALPLQVRAGVPDAVGMDPAEPVIALLFLLATALLLRGAGGARRTSHPSERHDLPRGRS